MHPSFLIFSELPLKKVESVLLLSSIEEKPFEGSALAIRQPLLSFSINPDKNPQSEFSH